MPPTGTDRNGAAARARVAVTRSPAVRHGIADWDSGTTHELPAAGRVVYTHLSSACIYLFGICNMVG